MAVDARPIDVDNNVLHEQRFFGGDIVWWALLLVMGVPVMLWGLTQAPQTGGFLLLVIGGVAAGISFAQIILRLPYLTRRFMFSVLLVILLAAVIGVIAQLFNMTLPVPTAPLDTMYKPPISGG